VGNKRHQIAGQANHRFPEPQCKLAEHIAKAPMARVLPITAPDNCSKQKRPGFASGHPPNKRHTP